MKYSLKNMTILVKLSFLLSFLPSYIFSQIQINKSLFRQIDSDIGVTNLSHFDSCTILLQTLRDFNLTETSNTNEVQKIDSFLTRSSNNNYSHVKITFDYNYENNISNLYFYYFFNNGWQINKQISNVYDKNKNLVKSTNELWNGNDWIKDFQQIFKYDSCDNNIEVVTQHWTDNDWVNDYRTTYIFDSLNNLFKRYIEEYEDSSWQVLSNATFTYNDQNLVDSILFKDLDFHVWKKTYLTTNYYDDHWNLSSQIAQRWNGNYWVNYLKLTYDYLKYGRQRNETSEIWVNDNWITDSRVIYYLDKQNYIQHAHFEYWDYDNWIAGDGVVPIRNPDGFTIYYITHEVNIYYDDPTGISIGEQTIPTEFQLYQNYPNPFNPTTTIRYSLPSSSVISNGERNLKDSSPFGILNDNSSGLTSVRLNVFDILGREVATLVDEKQKPGTYEIKFDGSNLSSGIYFYTIKVTGSNGYNFVKSKKMILAK